MKNLTIFTASLTVLLASCGDKTQFSSAPNPSQPSTPVVVEGRSETTSQPTPKRVASQANETPSSDDAVAPQEPGISKQETVGTTVALPVPESAPASSKPVDHTTSTPETSETPATKAPQTPSKDTKAPTPPPFTAQVEGEIAKAVASQQGSSGAALTPAQMQSLTGGLTSLVGAMAAGPVQGPAALGTLIDLIKSVKGIKANVAALPVALPVALPALADAAVLADLAAALADLAAAAADLDVAGIVAAIQDLIALIMDLIA